MDACARGKAAEVGKRAVDAGNAMPSNGTYFFHTNNISPRLRNPTVP
jgi:hypothetical protein